MSEDQKPEDKIKELDKMLKLDRQMQKRIIQSGGEK